MGAEYCQKMVGYRQNIIDAFPERRNMHIKHMNPVIKIFPERTFGFEEGKRYSEAKVSFERSYILQALTANQWNITKTAKMIDMPRSLLYRKMEKYGMKKGDRK